MLSLPSPSCRTFAFLLFSLMLGACGRSEPVARTDTVATATPPASAVADSTAVAERDLDVCALMPLADVARIVAPLTALQTNREAPAMKGSSMMCHYRFPGDPHVGIGIELPFWDDSARAHEAFAASHAMMKERGDVISNLADMPGVGDEAYTSDERGISSAGVAARVGSRTLRTIVGADQVDYALRSSIAKQLADEVIARLARRTR